MRIVNFQIQEKNICHNNTETGRFLATGFFCVAPLHGPVHNPGARAAPLTVRLRLHIAQYTWAFCWIYWIIVIMALCMFKMFYNSNPFKCLCGVQRPTPPPHTLSFLSFFFLCLSVSTCINYNTLLSLFRPLQHHFALRYLVLHLQHDSNVLFVLILIIRVSKDR